MPQLGERESQLPYLVTAGEMMQKLTPIRLATLSYLNDNDVEAQNEIADALGVSPTTVTTHLQLLSDFPRPLTIRKRRYELTSDGHAMIELYSSIFRSFDESFEIEALSNESEREKVGDYLAPIHETRSIAPFFVLYSVGRHNTDEDASNTSADSPTVQLKWVLEDVKEWEEERGKTASRKQVRRILQRFEEFGVVELAGDWITVFEKGTRQIRLLEGVLQLLEEDDLTEPETRSSTSQQSTTSRLTRNDTGDTPGETGRSSIPTQGEPRTEGDARSALPAMVPAYRVVPETENESLQSQSSAPILPLTATTKVDDMAEQIERIGQEYGNARLELVWTNLQSEMPEDETAPDSRLTPR